MKTMNGEEEKEEARIMTCGICLEDSPECGQYGLLSDCNHVFCYNCIMEWRKNGHSGVFDRRCCPTCRTHSRRVIPCTVFPPNPDAKEVIVLDYINRRAERGETDNNDNDSCDSSSSEDDVYSSDNTDNSTVDNDGSVSQGSIGYGYDRDIHGSFDDYDDSFDYSYYDDLLTRIMMSTGHEDDDIRLRRR